ncbi:MAG: HAD-IIIC family phosphatase [Porcipelethomonas sp.]
MKELLYPFDSAFLLKNKKKIRRKLLGDNTERIKKNIAVLGGSTTDDVISMLELFLLNQGIEPSFYRSEYGRYWQDAVFGNDELRAFRPDIIYIHTTSRNITEYSLDMNSTKEECDEALKRQFEHFRFMWERLNETYSCPVIQNNFEQPLYRILGNRDAWDHRGRVNFINRLNAMFCDYAAEHDGFYINDINYISACCGLDKWHDDSYWYMYKYAMNLYAIPELSFNIANIIKSVFGKNKKALALDLDNTLWGGVIGDDGVSGIDIGMETASAEAYRAFQEYIKEQRQIGVMLNVCSKNDYENAVAGLEHPDGVLRPDDFLCIKANWEPKDLNVESIANETGILPESIVFVDDNPAEREIVSRQLGVMAPEITTPEEYIRILDRNGFFEITSFTSDDLRRNEMYKQNAQRAAVSRTYENYSDYLLSLEMEAVIENFREMYIPRITQLTNKSNQFNLTTRRYTQHEIEEAGIDGNHICLYGRLADKFGDNGIVSVVIGRIEGKTLHIELWLMSCRVLKRDMEYAMLDSLVKECRMRGIEEIYGYYYRTKKNAMVKELFGQFGFEKLEADENSSKWRLGVPRYIDKNKVIKVKEGEAVL